MEPDQPLTPLSAPPTDAAAATDSDRATGAILISGGFTSHRQRPSPAAPTRARYHFARRGSATDAVLSFAPGRARVPTFSIVELRLRKLAGSGRGAGSLARSITMR